MNVKPVVSIITASYNSRAYISQTIESIRAQTYDRIQHIVVDGVSTDGTIDLLKKYGSEIEWKSEPDNGMYDAINKGFTRAKGDIYYYLNSDDLLFSKDTVENVVAVFLQNAAVDFVYGHCCFISAEGKELYTYKAPLFHRQLFLAFPRIVFHQPACFWRKEIHKPFDNTMKYCADSKFFRYICKEGRGKRINSVVSKFRVHNASLSVTCRQEMKAEDELLFGNVQKRKTPLLYCIVDIIYIRIVLNLWANIQRLILALKREPYL